MRAVACTLLMVGLLWDGVRAANSISSLRAAARAWEGELPCKALGCECVFKHQRGCCCAGAELKEVEGQIFVRVMDLFASVSQLGDSLLEVIGGMHVAFTASMSSRTNCLGPFTRNHSIPYDVIALNHGSGYNPALGIFTAPVSGLYSFSFSVYSKVFGEGKRMYYKPVQLMRNGEVVASMWEDNREDSEDSSSQTILLPLQQGGQVYVELLSGRLLCGNVQGLNTFSGSLLYPTQA